MKIKLFSIVALATVLIMSTSCGSSKDTTSKKGSSAIPTVTPDIPSDYPRFGADYLAKDETKGWEFEVRYDGGILFRDTENKILVITHKVEKMVAQGANVVSVIGESDAYAISAVIDVVDCVKNHKAVTIMVRRKADKKEFDYEGCGYYRGQQQIHDIWALQELNGKTFHAESFPREFPHFEFNLEEGSMSGFAGCNQVFGSISFDYNRMVFNTLASTKMYCEESSGVEDEILSILRGNPYYHIKDLHLYLELQDGRSLVLKKVD